MVRIKYSGFTCNVFARLFIIQEFLLCAVFVSLLYSTSILINISTFFLAVGFCALASFFTPAKRTIAFTRVRLDERGIKIARRFISYDEIRDISINNTYIEYRRAPKFLENIFGFRMHDKIFTEDIVCINCKFNGLEGYDPNRLYVPLNKKTHSILCQYCEKYKETFEKWSKDRIDYTSIEKCTNTYEKVSKIIGTLAFAFLIVLFVGMEILPINKIWLPLAFLILFYISNIFCSEISLAWYKIISKKLYI